MLLHSCEQHSFLICEQKNLKADFIGKSSLINIGSPVEMSIKEYAYKIKNIIDPKVIIKFDNNKKLDGVKRKKLDLSLANRNGWKSKMNFSKVLYFTIEDYKNSQK